MSAKFYRSYLGCLKRIGISISLILISFSSSSAAQNTRLHEVLSCHTSSDKPGIAIRIEHQGHTVFNEANGVRNMETMAPITPNDQFQIGSITKHFTATAILKLSEQRKLELSDTIGKFIPGIKQDYKRLTIRSLLNHTSGLGDYFNQRRITRKWDDYSDIDNVIKDINRIPVLSEPGEHYSYSNIGYLLLGKVIEVASGQPYIEFLETELFKPLGMFDTYVLEKGDTLDAVKGYTKNGNKLEAPEVVDRSWIYSAGAIVSTLEDMSRWHKALSNGQVIKHENYELMIRKANLSSGENVNYGLGLDIYPISNLNSYSHQGSVPGFMAWMVYFPEQDVFAMALSNNDRVHPGPALLDMVAIQLELSPKVIEVDTQQSENILLGKYRFDDGGALEIFVEEGELYAKSKEFDKRPIILRENNSFSYECTEDYFVLRENEEKSELVPISIYFGEQSPGHKL